MIYERSVMPITDHTVALDESDIEMTYTEQGKKVILTNTETGMFLVMFTHELLQAASVIAGDFAQTIKDA